MPTYQGAQYRDDGSPVNGSGPWINPNYAYGGAILGGAGGRWATSSSTDGGTTAPPIDPNFQFGTQGAGTGGLAMPSYAIGRPDYQPGAQPQDMSANLGMGATGYAPPGQLQPAPGYGSTTPPSGGMPNTGYASGTGPANGGGNPYLASQGGAIAQTMSDNLNRNFMPQLGMASMAAGGYGGSAQGVVQANAMKDMNLGLGSSLGNLYGQDWNNTQNRNLQRYQGDQGFYSTQRGQDQSGAALGASLMTQGQNGQWGPIQNASGTYSPYTGLGTSTQTGSTGGGATGVLGGALAGGIMSKYMGLGGTGSGAGSSSIYGPGNPNNMFDGVNTTGFWS